MTDTLSIFAGTIWAWLNAEQNAGALSAVLAVLTLAGGAGGWLWQRKSKAPAPDQTGGIGAGGSMTNNTITINNGLTPEQIAAIFAGVRDLSQSSEAKAIAVADQFGTISREALTSFFTILRHEQVPPEQLTAKLTSVALQYREMVDRLTALEQAAGPDDRPILAEARAAIEKGDYDRAESLLVTLENAQATARAKAQANADDLARRQAATRAERARLSTLRFDHRTAADHFLAAANLLPTGDTESRGQYLTDSADALVDYGDKLGDNNALLAAITRYREAMPSRESHSTLWARVQNNLGTALQSLGERDGDSARLRQAVDAFNNALLEYTRDRAPLDWAMTQNNLGISLSRIAKNENESILLIQAIESFKDALLEYNQDYTPIEWATTHNNLGNALTDLGEYNSDTSLLQKAIESYKCALLVRTREQFPLSWATTLHNLGGALRKLGEYQRDSTLLQQAIDSYKCALIVRTREQFPLSWATTQNNLGSALSALGVHENNSARLREAIENYESALFMKIREESPILWGTTQTNMGDVLRILAEMTCDSDSARQAVTAQEAALEIFIHLNASYYITIATQNLAEARATLAKLESSTAPAPHQ